MALRDTSWDVFYGVLARNLTELLPVVYTPTVGDACLEWSALLPRPVGLYVSFKDQVPGSCFWVFYPKETCSLLG